MTITEITHERWEQAQDGELVDQLGNLEEWDNSKFYYIRNLMQEFFDIDFEEDFKDKFIIEVGAGPKGYALFTEGNFKRCVVIEPLMDRFPEYVKEDYEKMGCEVYGGAFEDVDYEGIDEIWFFNVLQHVLNPEEQLKKAKANAKVVRVFEPINYPANLCHPHVLTAELFTGVFGEDFGTKYVGGSRTNFHTADCYYGTWVRED